MNHPSMYSFPVADSFKVETLKEYFINEASLDNVNDEIAELAFQNYLNDLSLEATKEAKALADLNINFAWNLQDIQLNMTYYYNSENYPNETHGKHRYSMRGYDGEIYFIHDALVASVVSNVCIHTSVENFWLNRQRIAQYN